MVMMRRIGDMKLIFCPHCDDVVKLRTEARRSCWCGKSGGMYQRDGLNAIVDGDAVPLGFLNSTLGAALKERPQSGMGSRFEAFVIPHRCPTVSKY
jgi:hypothetical protein